MNTNKLMKTIKKVGFIMQQYNGEEWIQICGTTNNCNITIPDDALNGINANWEFLEFQTAK